MWSLKTWLLVKVLTTQDWRDGSVVKNLEGLAEDPGLVPATRCSQLCVASSRSPAPSVSVTCLHMAHRHSHTDTHINTNNK